MLEIIPTINQTGGANGVSRGLYVNPTLTAAADFRAIETARGNVIFGSTSGNVGIGSTVPRAKLDVEGSVYFGNGNIGVGSSAPAQKLDVLGNIYVNGNVGIGSSAPLRPLDVVGVAYFNGNVGIGSTVPRASLDIVSSNLSAISYFGTNVGIGSTVPGQMLDVTGVIRQSNCKTAGTLSANTSGDIICTSDERLKDIKGYYQGGLEALSAIRPIRFAYKGESFVHVGFSAQNVKSVLPEASALQDSGYWSLDDTAIGALMVNAIKEQQIQIAALSERVFSLSKVVQVDRSTLQALRIENDQVKERLKELMAVVCRERADEPACQ